MPVATMDRRILIGAGLGIPLLAFGSGYAIATPRNVASLMAELLLPEPDHSIYDPCCGAGRLLLAADDVRRRRLVDGAPDRGVMYGQEIQAVPAALARRAMKRRGTTTTIAGGSSLTHPAFLDGDAGLLLVDRALANPNWTQPLKAEIHSEDTYERFGLGRPPLDIGDWTWAQHLLSHLKPNGNAVMLIDAEITSRDGSKSEPTAERAIRRNLIESGHLLTVISNPWPLSRRPGFMTHVTRGWLPKAVVLVFGKSPNPGGVLMVELSPLISRYQAGALSAEQVIREAVRLHQSRAEVAGTTRLVPAEALLASGVNLTPAVHV